VHEVHRQPLIVGTTGTVTRGDLRADTGENLWVASGGDFGGEKDAVAAGVTIAAIGNEEEKPTRDLGDLRGPATWAPWRCATCSITRVHAA